MLYTEFLKLMGNSSNVTMKEYQNILNAYDLSIFDKEAFVRMYKKQRNNPFVADLLNIINKQQSAICEYEKEKKVYNTCKKSMYLARDKNGQLWIYPELPKYSQAMGFWYSTMEPGFALETNGYPEVTFENSPVEIIGLSLKLKKE